MQNCKMEQNDQQQQTGSIQVMPTAVLGNGQQIILQSLQQQLNASGQQLQVVPIIQGGQQTSYIVQPQAPQPQIVQLPDGQTFIYHQPVMTDNQQSQPQIVNINGNFFQIPAQQTVAASAAMQNQTATVQSPAQPTQQVVMIPSTQPDNQIQQNTTNVNNFNTNNAASPPPQPSTSSTPTPAAESEEEPLYVNASKSRSHPTVPQLIPCFPSRTIQKNSYSTYSKSETRSSRQNSETTTEISL